MKIMLRKILLFYLGILLICLGYLHYTYYVNFFSDQYNFLIPRVTASFGVFNIAQIIKGIDPRLYSMLFYLMSSVSLNILFIRLYFNSIVYSKWVAIAYFFVLIIGAIIAGLVMLVNFDFGLSLLQKLKNSLSSPVLVLFIIPLLIFFKSEKIAQKDV